jgi:hypothetical protein
MSSAFSPAASHCGSGTQSESVNARISPEEAATAPLRAGPAPRSVTVTSLARPAIASATFSGPEGEALSPTTISKSSRG